VSEGIERWRRVVEAEVRERKLALATGRQALARAEQFEALLLAERERRDQAERERRVRGELQSFADERMNALLERAIERAAEKVAAAKAGEAAAVERLRESWQRATGLDRLLARRRARAELERRRAEQTETDESASRARAQQPALSTRLQDDEESR
jgi:flagellar biosynthesis chaperone FliJ